jgi:hypothetical protein
MGLEISTLSAEGGDEVRERERCFMQETNMFVDNIQEMLAHISLNSRNNPVSQTFLHCRKRAYPRC